MLQSLGSRDGDGVLYLSTIYGSCPKTLQSLEHTTPVCLTASTMSYPIEDHEVLRLLEQTVQSVRSRRTAKLAFFDNAPASSGARFLWRPHYRYAGHSGP